MIKVSCVMPTADRLRFVPKAIENFLEQTYTNSVLEIVDDGRESCAHLIPSGHPRINYFYYRRPKLSTGAKRNFANNLATGTVLMHWDDDDWYHPERIGMQLGDLHESNKQVTGFHSIAYYREKDQKAFWFDDPEFRPNAAGTSLCYYRTWWEQHPFHDRQTAEDFLFCVEAAQHNQIATLNGKCMVVARIHDSNTCQPPLGTRKYPEVCLEHLPQQFLWKC